MNRIVKEHYLAAKLPDDLREGIDPHDRVTVTVMPEPAEATSGPARPKRGLFGAAKERATSIEEAVARIRSLREEWN
ncbi:MAG: hypothetical protein WD036_12365 [Bauldia sp.]